MARDYDNMTAERKAKYPDTFSDAKLNPAFVRYFNSQERITVEFRGSDGEVYETKRGTIGVTTGWVPCFILMLTKRSHGSSYTIGENDTVSITGRLEYLRGELRGERISYAGIAELQTLAPHISADDVELLEAAGVPEF